MTLGLSKEDQDRIDRIRTVTQKKPSRISQLFDSLKEIANSFQKVSLRDKVTFFQLLSVMINAGVPIIRSLYVLADQLTNANFKAIIRRIAASMEEGISLSEAMEEYDNLFSQAERGMIASGEASGNLDEILKDIAKQAEKNAYILSKVRNAMIYPAVIICIMIISAIVMLTVVIPKLSSLFMSVGEDLPFATQVLMRLSDFAKVGWPFLIFLVAAAGIGLHFARKYRKSKLVLDLFILHIPIFGIIIRNLMIARFNRALSSLLQAGIPIVRALKITGDSLGNEVYKERIYYAAQDVAQGIPLGENLIGNDFIFPPMVSSMVLVGEQTANLTEVTTKIAEHYEEQIDNAVTGLSKVIEPIILLFMGVMVGFLVMAIMQPIIKISDVSVLL